MLWIAHRARRTFTFNFGYKFKEDGPIADSTILQVDPNTGEVVKAMGGGETVLAHGVYVDHDDNVWFTDVGSHQVKRFNKQGKVDWVYGEERTPGGDEQHLCLPTNVVVDRYGAVYISDGYCNTRVLKIDIETKEVLAVFEIPRKYNHGIEKPAFVRNPVVVHSVAMAGCFGQLFVADRERRQVVVFSLTSSDVIQVIDLTAHGRVWAVRMGPLGNPLVMVEDENSNVAIVELGRDEVNGFIEEEQEQAWWKVGTTWALPDLNVVHDFAVGAVPRGAGLPGLPVIVIYVVETPKANGRVVRYFLMEDGAAEIAAGELQGSGLEPQKRQVSQDGDDVVETDAAASEVEMAVAGEGVDAT